MVKPITLYNGSSGLNTVLDPQRLSQGNLDNPGMIELAQAVNVSVDERGLVSLRPGSTLLVEGAYHSLFCDGGDCFVVKDRSSDAAIYHVNDSDPSILTLVTDGLTKGIRVEFAQANTDTFYSNGTQNGFIREMVRYDWPVQSYYGPDVDIQFLASIPKPNHIAFRRGGQCIIAVDDYVLINHEPFKFGLFSPVHGFIKFSSKVVMLCPTIAGFYASDQTSTWFFRKQSEGWYRYIQELVDTSPVMEWSLARGMVLLRDAGYDIAGYGFVWASKKGVCIGTEGGQVLNITKDMIVYPASGYSVGACLIKDDKKVVNTLS